jgi:hypothetical protein
VVLFAGGKINVNVDEIIDEIYKHVEDEGNSHPDEYVKDPKVKRHKEHQIGDKGIGLHPLEPVDNCIGKKPVTHPQRILFCPWHSGIQGIVLFHTVLPPAQL